ncbi:uncharacterized protein LOC111602558 isoform X2 [Drosophila hydei]|uniref:Uncharacterized protein LOC111602558 isoform X2 n=1 Tax=Drosophila hydei TaxID=7224 RepID=A0A6J2T0S9_DROHY|nr:uncharacterized protein LOC111602558 isoform X2 [Drosophila hydei]
MEKNETEINEKSAVAVLTSEVKVLSIGKRREYFKPKRHVIKFDKQIFLDDCKKHYGLLLMGNRTRYVPNNNFLMDLFKMETIEKDNQPRRYHFDCHPCVCPGSSMSQGIFGQTLYASAVMHELKKRLKNKKWISKNVLELPKKENAIRSKYYYGDDYYVQNIVIDIIQEQKIKAFQFLFNLHKEYVKERQESK